MDSLGPLEALAPQPKLKAKQTDQITPTDGGGSAFEDALAKLSDERKQSETASEETGTAAPAALTPDSDATSDASQTNTLILQSSPSEDAILVTSGPENITEPISRNTAVETAELGRSETVTAIEGDDEKLRLVEGIEPTTKPQANELAASESLDTKPSSSAEKQIVSAALDVSGKTADADAPPSVETAAQPKPPAVETSPPLASDSGKTAPEDSTQASERAPSATLAETKPDAPQQPVNANAGEDVAPTSSPSEPNIRTQASPPAPEFAAQTTPSPSPDAQGTPPATVTAEADVAKQVGSDTSALADAQALKQAQTQAQSTGMADALQIGDAAPNVLGSTAAPATAAAPGSIIAPQAMQAQQAILVASPSDIPDLVSRVQTQGTEDGDQRILVRLDPPELGKVSIDFKFDAQGLQHVTITAETPEAIKRLREMHFELVQGLEQHGLAGQDMTFRQETPGQNSSLAQLVVEASEEVETSSSPIGQIPALNSLTGADVPRDASGRLNIRL